MHYRSFLMIPDSAFKHAGANGLIGQPSNTTDSHRIRRAPCSKMHMKGSCQMYNSMCCFTGYRGMSVAPSKVWCGHQDDIFFAGRATWYRANAPPDGKGFPMSTTLCSCLLARRTQVHCAQICTTRMQRDGSKALLEHGYGMGW